MWSPLAINLEYIAAYIERDVEDIMIVNQEFDDTDIALHIQKFKPDLFGVTMSATDHVEGLALCNTAKEFGLTTIVGGYHPTAIPGDILAHPQIDMVFRGESEIAMSELIKRGSPEDVAGISYRDNGHIVHNAEREPIKDLDSLPFPARHLREDDYCKRWVKVGGRHRDQVHLSRGCWGRCTFCCEPSMSKSKQRYRSPKMVFQEIKEIYEMHGREPLFILFGDPHFMGRPKLVEELCDLLIEEDMDIHYTAMVRADSIARHPAVVTKMVKAGIIAYCMGIESPSCDDLDGTKKGISNEIQAKAVRTLRDNNAIAGGTFVIGLPGQTEEEIKTFPEYARNLGMINAAFAIATPQAGTEFYDELENKGLIDVRDWTKYDQMHSVFKHDSISRERLEELLAYCLGRFYAPDIFIDDMIETQFRENDGRKTTLFEAFRYLKDRLDFVTTAGAVYRPDDGSKYGEIFLGAQNNPWTRKRTEKIGVHNMMELGPFLKVFGEQKVQISVSNGNGAFVHYVLKTTKDTLEYIDVTDKGHEDVTLQVDADLSPLRGSKARAALGILKQIIKRRQLTVLTRGLAALLADRLAVSRRGKRRGQIVLPPEYATTGCVMDGWKN